MKYTMTEPCSECPFTMSRKAFTDRRLKEFAQGAFPCHKTAELEETETGSAFVSGDKSVHCAGALIYCEKRGSPNQLMRIAERLGMYDHTKLKMDSKVR